MRIPDAGNEDLKCPNSVNLAVVIDRNGYWKSGMVTNLYGFIRIRLLNLFSTIRLLLCFISKKLQKKLKYFFKSKN